MNKHGMFLTGFIPKIVQICEKNGWDWDLKFSSPMNLGPEPNLPGITFREDQNRLMNTAIISGRGVLKAPTGSGKTVLIAGLISSFKDKKVLFLCHTISLLTQTKKEFESFGLGPVSLINSKSKDLSGNIVVATMQSLSHFNIEDYCDLFDVVFVDEAHHVSSFDGTYAKLLKGLLAPVKIGVTATISKNEEAKLAMEGLLGPMIDEVTLKEGIEKEFVATPIIELIKIPYNDNIRSFTKYKDIYEAGIVNHRKRNRIIMEKAISLMQSGKSVLIYVSHIDHGHNLQDMGEYLGKYLPFIWGDTPEDHRETIKQGLQDKKLMGAIASVVWKEGINIKSLDTIMIAGGGKSELALLQTVGRGLRRDDEKTEVLIVDFLDSAKYLSEHAIERLGVYIENGWRWK